MQNLAIDYIRSTFLNPSPVEPSAAIVDRLAHVKAQIAQLADEEKKLKSALIELGEPKIAGTLHQASVSHCEGRLMIDWQAIAEHFNPSRQLVTAHTSRSEPFAVVRVSARKGI